jgi:hypothetical protein
VNLSGRLDGDPGRLESARETWLGSIAEDVDGRCVAVAVRGGGEEQ